MQFHRPQGIGAVGAVVRAFRRHHEHHRAAQHLRRLDDHLLQDIGITRAQAERAALGRLGTLD